VTKTEHGIRFAGQQDRDVAHRDGSPHTTVLLVPVKQTHRSENPRLVLHRRSASKRTSPDCLDFCGGHLVFAERFATVEPSKVSYDLQAATVEAACREANEELHCTPIYRFTAKDLHQFEGLGNFECRTKMALGSNVEYSTAFLIGLPTPVVRIYDTDESGREQELSLKEATVAEVLELFARDPGQFADGASRILNSVLNTPESAQKFEELLCRAANPPSHPLCSYRVIWHDHEDGRTGEPVEVIASTAKDAYKTAAEWLARLTKMFSVGDIEVLVDEAGKHHYPDHFRD
jgi:8-oxo-dGTP pyrophosphatase MutT (NUDIX family)